MANYSFNLVSDVLPAPGSYYVVLPESMSPPPGAELLQAFLPPLNSSYFPGMATYVVVGPTVHPPSPQHCPGCQEEDDALQKLCETVAALLVTLTDDSYHPNWLQGCVVDSLVKAEALVNMIFNKALFDPGTSALCANLCCSLFSLESLNFIPKKVLLLLLHKRASVELDRHLGIFNFALVQQYPTRHYEQEDAMHQEFLNLIRFMGELFMVDLQSSKVVLLYLDTFLAKPTNDMLEALVLLITRTGRKVEEVERAETGVPRCLNSKMLSIQKILYREEGGDKADLTPKVHSMLTGLLNLYWNGWVPLDLQQHQVLPTNRQQLFPELQARSQQVLDHPLQHQAAALPLSMDQWLEAGGLQECLQRVSVNDPRECQAATLLTDCKAIPQDCVLTASPQRMHQQAAALRAQELLSDSLSIQDLAQSASPLAVPWHQAARLTSEPRGGAAVHSARNEMASSVCDGPFKSVTGGDQLQSAVQTHQPTRLFTPLRSDDPDYELKKRAHATMDEYSSTGNVNLRELLTRVKSEDLPKVLLIWMQRSIKFPDREKRSYLARCICNLLGERVISSRQLLATLKEFMDSIGGLESVSAEIRQSTVELILPCVANDRITLRMIYDFLKPAGELVLSVKENVIILLMSTLRTLQVVRGAEWLKIRWVAASIETPFLFQHVDDQRAFFSSHGLLYLEDAMSTFARIPLEHFGTEVGKIMRKQDSFDLEDLLSWITSTAGPNISTAEYLDLLTRIVCDVSTSALCDVDMERFRGYCHMLKLFANAEDDLELAVVEGVLFFVNGVLNSKRLLKSMLQMLVHEGVIKIETVRVWLAGQKPRMAKRILDLIGSVDQLSMPPK